jgi:hypothetical protein
MSTRITNCGLVYLRRSGKRQETSLDTQLGWATRAADQTGVDLDASPADLKHMRDNFLHSYKSIRLDDGITGSDPTRPGFKALIHDSVSDRSISHIFAFRRDRLFRPEEPVEALQTEKQLSRAGVTIVFSTEIVPPRQRGKRDLAKDIGVLLEYNEAGAFCEQLAERMILTHKSLAAKGFSTGGNPPYGHVRALFSPDGELVEILAQGRTVRQDGFHVRWIPGMDDENRAKIKAWIYILEEYEAGRGAKRIAYQLNSLGIPSPGAGTLRTDSGAKHRVSGKWSTSTVLDLIKNSAIAGAKTYGVRSEGKHRRLDEDGWRYLNDKDRDTNDSPKVIRNPEHLVVRAASGAGQSFDPQRLDQIQAKLAERGRSQRGIPRAKDPAKYPLSGRVIDLSNGCGDLMYGVTQSGRPLYKCGRYMRTSGAECDNNAVDAEALLRHILGSLLNSVPLLFSRAELEAELLKLAKSHRSTRESDTPSEQARIDSRLAALNEEAALICRNLARAKDAEIYAEIEAERTKIKAEILRLQESRQRLTSGLNSAQGESQNTVEHEVRKALSKLEDIQRIASSPEARLEIRAMLQELGCRVGLSFFEATKGKKRLVRKLAGGIIVFDDGDLPVKLHGKDRLSDDGENPSGPALPTCRSTADLPHKCGSPGANNDIRITKGTSVPSTIDVFSSQCHQEEVSFTKVNRADWIRTSDLLTPSCSTIVGLFSGSGKNIFIS